ncbi:hypothetical protein CP968_18355 [Streptomyces subrutilus]|uniref:Uncharacterized protein n=1 Tax=Streptomyces subrutilus TaxID=36818 RepID=A0A5P2UY02_9ACTN|nr:hypothetical protein CP968_18355 [Streptomyces subrutilus]
MSGRATGTAHLAECAGPRASRLGDRPVHRTESSEEHPVLEAVFTSLLVLVCVGVMAFTGLAVKKLYQGQR